MAQPESGVPVAAGWAAAGAAEAAGAGVADAAADSAVVDRADWVSDLLFCWQPATATNATNSSTTATRPGRRRGL
jgi:hypothetical protein